VVVLATDDALTLGELLAFAEAEDETALLTELEAKPE